MHIASFKIGILKVQDFENFELPPMQSRLALLTFEADITMAEDDIFMGESAKFPKSLIF